jgi:methyl-accepting chemotaxis protein
MLAVNGAIEAARAGEFGKGFVVVSTDIRNLAHDSSENADRIKDMVKSVQDQISAVRRDLEEIATNTSSEVEKTRFITKNMEVMETDMAEVLAGNQSISAGAASIMSALGEVKKGVDQIASAAAEAEQAATQAASASQEQSQGAEELAAAIEEISSLADELQSV